jgi:hypothetical protein
MLEGGFEEIVHCVQQDPADRSEAVLGALAQGNEVVHENINVGQRVGPNPMGGCKRGRRQRRLELNQRPRNGGGNG